MTPARTPVLAAAGGIVLKPENRQPGGSYKIRGVARLFGEAVAPPQGYSTASAGNLGRALAAACLAAGVPCTVYVPDGAPGAKKEKIAGLGAELVELPFAEIWNLLLEPPAHCGFVHPTRRPELRRGYGDIGRELADDVPGLSAVVVPFGLGGLAMGVAHALREQGIPVYAAELADQAPLAAAFAGHAIARPLPHGASFVDAIGTPRLLPGMLEEARAFLAGTIPVTLAEARASLAILSREHGETVEGAAAVAFAAAGKLRREIRTGEIAAVLSGGNIAPAVHANALREHDLEIS